ncbi:MAG: AsmA-like C-terminal region-containing protein [Pseudolabrys sp.]
MQTTLLGLAIAIILALVAALVGPLLIDWGTHRSLFEAEASRLIGVDVRVTGPIEARLLPTPSLTLHDIEIGKSGVDTIRARLLGFEFALGPLMRGEWRAAEVHLVGPQMRLGLDPAGHVQAPNLTINFSPDNLSIDRLSVEGGIVTLSDAANGGSATLQGLWFNGEARSLLGPFKGEGAATVGDELYPFRIATGRYSDDGALKLHINVDPVSRPLSIVADGMLALAGAKPTFDGTLDLTRPVGIATRGAAQPADTLSQPWHLSGKIKANAASALMQQFEFQYGSEEQGLKLTGVADFNFGKHPRFDGVLSGRQIDLDRALSGDDGSQPPPAVAIRRIAQLAGGAFRPAIPIQIGIGIDQVKLGGNSVANVRGDISTDAGGWNLDRFEFRAPGFTQVKLSGHMAVKGDGVSFTGPAEIEAGDPKVLAAWLEGRADATQGDVRPLTLRGDVTFGNDKLAVERLQAAFDRKTMTGRFAYVFASGTQAAKLDAALKAPELDIDAALAFGNALFAGSPIERPRDMTIAADIGRATIGGFVARDASARVKVDGNGVQIDRLAVADFGGGSFSASGRIDTGGHTPRGSLALDFESGQAAAIAALLEKFAPKTAKPATGLLDRVNHAKLHATLDVADDKQTSGTVAQVAVTGALDAMAIDLRARLSGHWRKPAAADIRLDGSVDAPDGAALLKLIGLDRYLAAGKGAGQLKLLVAGPADRDQTIDLRLRADGLFAQSTGHGRISLDKGLQLTSTLQVAKADLRPLRPAGMAGGSEPLPFSLNSRVAIADRAISFDDINARLGSATVRGNLAFDGQTPRKVSGALEADTLEAAPLIAAAIGMPVAASSNGSAAWVWSSEPFAGDRFGALNGEIALKARQAELLPRLTAREFRAKLRFDKDGFVVDDVAGDVSGGRLSGALSFRSAEDGLKAHGKISLTGVDAASLLPSGARPPATGALALSADVEGAGLSPVALIGSLQGSGKIALGDGQWAGLDPRAFDAVTRAVDQGLPIDAGRISDAVSKALDSGELAVHRAEATLAVSAGQVRLNNAAVDSKDAALSIAGNLDLTDGSLDARLVLSGSGQAGGARPDIFMALKGPLAAPARSIDVSALTGWLTLRAVENQARQLHDIENEQRQAKPPAPRPKSELAPALPAPVEIARPPGPRRNPPEASVGSQN